jgi:Fibronectin type III domain
MFLHIVRSICALRVFARGLQSRRSLSSGIVTAIVLSSSLLAGSAEAGTLTVQWDRNTEADVAGYYVSYGTQAGQYPTTVDVGNQTSHQFTEPDPTQTYYFVVRAYSSTGLISSYSQEVHSTPSSTSPQPPTAPAESASGTTIPSAAKIVDASGNVWTQGTMPMACGNASHDPSQCLPGYKNGVLVSSGYEWLYLDHVVYTHGEEGHWWKYNANNTWTDMGTTSPKPAAPAESPSGTVVPTAAQIVDSTGAIWTQSATQVSCPKAGNCYPGYRNGEQVNIGTQIAYRDKVVYVLGWDGHWWKYNGGTSWTDLGTTSPMGPAAPAESPSGTVVPTAAQIVDSTGAIWTQSATQVACPKAGSCYPGYRNGVQVNIGTQIAYLDKVVYVLGWDGHWWKFNGGSSWTDLGTTSPLGPQESASGTVVPTAAQIIDATGATWTQSATQVSCPKPGSCYPGYRNGELVNIGTQIYYLNKVVYVLGWDGHWWRFNGGTSWTDVGTTRP